MIRGSDDEAENALRSLMTITSPLRVMSSSFSSPMMRKGSRSGANRVLMMGIKPRRGWELPWGVGIEVASIINTMNNLKSIVLALFPQWPPTLIAVNSAAEAPPVWTVERRGKPPMKWKGKKKEFQADTRT